MTTNLQSKVSLLDTNNTRSDESDGDFQCQDEPKDFP